MQEESSAKYECAVSRKEERQKRRTSEAAEAVRHIQRVDPFTKDWVKLTAYVERLARVVAAEDELPAQMVEGILGRDEEGETLWDQAKHENAIRLIVEQCKVNVLLRLLHDYKLATLGETGTPVPEAKPLLVQRRNKTVDCGKVFAGATLLLLVRSLQHLEAVQLMDLSLFVEHVAYVLRRSAEAGPTPALREEYLLLRLLEAFMKHLENINSAVLGYFQDHQLIPLFIEHVVMHKARLPSDALASTAQTLTFLSDCEDFQLQWEDHMPKPETRRGLLEIEEMLGKLSPEDRANFRPFLDFCRKVKKTV